MKATAQLIADAAFGHLSKRVKRHFKGRALAGARVIAQEKIKYHRAGKFGRSPKPAMSPIVRGTDLAVGRVEDVRAELAAARMGSGHFSERQRGTLRGFLDGRAIVLPGLGDSREQSSEARAAEGVVGGPVGPAEKRL